MPPTVESTPILPSCACGDPLCAVLYGLCHCGCAERTAIATQTQFRYKSVAGLPRLYVNGHNRVRPRLAVEVSVARGERIIPLTRDKYAVLDVEDYERFSVFRYHFSGKYAKRIIASKDAQGRTIRSAAWLHNDILPPPPGMVTDHINGDYMDHRRSNLRNCWPWENTQNRKVSSRNTSGYSGVWWSERDSRWIVTIGVKGAVLRLGMFKEKEQAIKIRLAAEAQYYGEFSRQLGAISCRDVGSYLKQPPPTPRPPSPE